MGRRRAPSREVRVEHAAHHVDDLLAGAATAPRRKLRNASPCVLAKRS